MKKNTTETKTSLPRWEGPDCFQGTQTWLLMSSDGKEVLAQIERERPMRWHANGVGGQVRDREAPYQWFAVVFSAEGTPRFNLEIEDGTPVRAAKKAAEAALTTI